MAGLSRSGFLLAAHLVVGIAQGAQFIGEIHCGEQVTELDTGNEASPGLWRISRETAAACGVVDTDPVAGRIAGDVLTLYIPVNRLVRKMLTQRETATPYTPGNTATWFDWSASANCDPLGSSYYLRGTARHGQSRVSGWYDTMSNKPTADEWFWQSGRWRAGNWFDKGALTGLLYGPDDYSASPTRDAIRGHFQAPVFGDAVRVFDAAGHEVRKIQPGGAGLYDLTEIATQMPAGGRILIDGQSYEPKVDHVIEPGLGLQAFVGYQTLFDLTKAKRESRRYAFVRVPFKAFDRVAYGTLASDGARLEAFYRGELFSSSGYMQREWRGASSFFNVSVSVFGFSASVYSPNHELRQRAGSNAYTILSFNRNVGAGFLSVFSTRYDTGTRTATARYTIPWKRGVLAVEMANQTAGGKSVSGAFLTATFFLDKVSSSASNSGAFSASIRNDTWQAGLERQVTLDGRQYDALTAQADLAAARVFARYGITGKNASVTASGRMIAGESFSFARQGGDGVLTVEGPANATVMIDGQRQGRLPSTGRASFALTPETPHYVSVDDEDSLEILKDAERKIRLRDGEEVRIRFDTESLK